MKMQSQSDLKIFCPQVEATHCFKCGTCHVEDECTTFVESFYWSYQADEVFLIGEWSDWKKKEPMVKMETYFVSQVSLNLGSYQYKFIVDGEWIHDDSKPIILNAYGSYNNLKQVYPKRAYLDEHHISQEDQNFVQVTIQTTLLHEGLKIIGNWDNWTVERPLELEANSLKNSYSNSIKIRLEKKHLYEFKFKNNNGEYFIDEHYPAMKNQKGTLNNYILTSNFIQISTPRAVQQILIKTNSVRQTDWEWEREQFQNLQSYNLYGHSLTRIGNMIYIFGGIFKNEFRDYLIKIPLIDLSRYEQEKVNIPPRAYHTSVADGDKIIIFGGLNTSILNDCMVYNTATQEWSDSLVINGDPPTNRQKSTSVLYKDSIIVYGGYFCCPKTGVQIIHNDLYVLNTQSMTWSNPSKGIKNGPPRFAHTATIYEDEMLVFGGICSKELENSNQLWKLKIEKDKLSWSLAETSGNPPSARHGHTANILTRYLVIFGGANNQKQIFNDVMMLDLQHMEWTVPSICGEVPRGVTYHAAVEVANELIVIGGKTEGKKYTPGVLILKPKNERRKSFCILSPKSPTFDEQEVDTVTYYGY